jgi:hypothetical protein
MTSSRRDLHPLDAGRTKIKTRNRELLDSASCGCAGLQLDFPAQQFQGVAELWVPFEEAIVIRWR